MASETTLSTAPPTTDPQPSTWDYSPAPERVPVEIADQSLLFINGKWAKPKSRRYFQSPTLMAVPLR